jgi:choline monooxygenase
VFVSPDPDAEPLEEALGGLPALVADTIELDGLKFHARYESPIGANWKVVLENFLECYHCPTAHPGFSKVVDTSTDAYRLQVHPTFTSQLAPVRESVLSGNGQTAYRPRDGVVHAQYHLLFPVTTVNISPGILNVGIERYVPDGLKRTIEVTDYYFAPDATAEEIEELTTWDGQTGQEDISLVESVQRGLDSGTVPQGRLMSESEQLIADFQRRVRDALAG